MKQFFKNDQAFICSNCGKTVSPLGYTSRDHCPYCLYSVHVDILPGDRANECKGLLEPIGLKIDGKKGYVIEYKCKKCKQFHHNKSAQDDSQDVLFHLGQR